MAWRARLGRRLRSSGLQNGRSKTCPTTAGERIAACGRVFDLPATLVTGCCACLSRLSTLGRAATASEPERSPGVATRHAPLPVNDLRHVGRVFDLPATLVTGCCACLSRPLTLGRAATQRPSPSVARSGDAARTTAGERIAACGAGLRPASDFIHGLLGLPVETIDTWSGGDTASEPERRQEWRRGTQQCVRHSMAQIAGSCGHTSAHDLAQNENRYAVGRSHAIGPTGVENVSYNGCS